MPYAVFIFICLIWGSNFILMKKALLCFGPMSVAAMRVLGGAAVLLLIWSVAREPWRFTRRDLMPMVFVIIAAFIWPYTVQPYLIDRIQHSAFIGMMVCFVPLLTILVSIPMLGVYPTRRQLFGVLVGLACITVLMADGLNTDALTPGDGLLAMTVPLGYAAANTFIKRRMTHVPTLSLSCVSLVAACAALIPLSVAFEAHAVQRNDHLPWAIAAMAWMGVIGTGIATYLFFKLIHDHGPLFAGMVTYVIPVIAILWGAADRERFTVTQLAALAGVLAMVAVVQYGTPAPAPSVEPVAVE